MSRRMTAALAVAALAGTLLLPAATAQMAVTVGSQEFSWAGKRDQQATYTWEAMIDNPSRRELTVNVTLQLLDANDEVVSSNTKVVNLARESSTTVSGDGSMAFADAERSTRFRVMLSAAQDTRD